MRKKSHFTSCNICNKSIHVGEQHVSLNLHRETGNESNGQKTINVQFAETLIVTCIDCGKYLNQYAQSSELIDHFRNSMRNNVRPSASKEDVAKKVEVPSQLEGSSIQGYDISGQDTGMTINEVDGITPVPALNKESEANNKRQTSEQRTFSFAKKQNLSETQIEYLKTLGKGEVSMILSLLERKDCSHNFDAAVKAVIDDFPF